MDSALFERIVGLLAFFALWNFPLRQREIEAWAGTDLSSEFLKTNFFSFETGVERYFSTNQNVALLRKTRSAAEQNMKLLLPRAQRFAHSLRHFPFLRAMALSNTIALRVPNAQSDIDLFCVVRPGRMWTARFFATLFFSLLGLRTRKGETAGKFCLSFFVDEAYIDFSALKKERDIYLAFWVRSLRPCFGNAYFSAMKPVNRSWVEEETLLPWRTEYPEALPESQSVWQRFFEFLLPPVTEPLFRFLLQRKARKFTEKNSSAYAPEMIFRDDIQKLHNPDRRDELQRNWEQNVHEFLGQKSL